MGSKNNLKLRSEKMAQRKAKYKIKKLNVGVASVMVGALLAFSNADAVNADGVDTATNDEKTTQLTESTENETEVALTETPEENTVTSTQTVEQAEADKSADQGVPPVENNEVSSAESTTEAPQEQIHATFRSAVADVPTVNVDQVIENNTQSQAVTLDHGDNETRSISIMVPAVAGDTVTVTVPYIFTASTGSSINGELYNVDTETSPVADPGYVTNKASQNTTFTYNINTTASMIFNLRLMPTVSDWSFLTPGSKFQVVVKKNGDDIGEITYTIGQPAEITAVNLNFDQNQTAENGLVKDQKYVLGVNLANNGQKDGDNFAGTVTLNVPKGFLADTTSIGYAYGLTDKTVVGDTASDFATLANGKNVTIKQAAAGEPVVIDFNNAKTDLLKGSLLLFGTYTTELAASDNNFDATVAYYSINTAGERAKDMIQQAVGTKQLNLAVATKVNNSWGAQFKKKDGEIYTDNGQADGEHQSDDTKLDYNDNGSLIRSIEVYNNGNVAQENVLIHLDIEPGTIMNGGEGEYALAITRATLTDGRTVDLQMGNFVTSNVNSIVVAIDDKAISAGVAKDGSNIKALDIGYKNIEAGTKVKINFSNNAILEKGTTKKVNDTAEYSYTVTSDKGQELTGKMSLNIKAPNPSKNQFTGNILNFNNTSYQPTSEDGGNIATITYQIRNIVQYNDIPSSYFIAIPQGFDLEDASQLHVYKHGGALYEAAVVEDLGYIGINGERMFKISLPETPWYRTPVLINGTSYTTPLQIVANKNQLPLSYAYPENGMSLFMELNENDQVSAPTNGFANISEVTLRDGKTYKVRSTNLGYYKTLNEVSYSFTYPSAYGPMNGIKAADAGKYTEETGTTKLAYSSSKELANSKGTIRLANVLTDKGISEYSYNVINLPSIANGDDATIVLTGEGVDKVTTTGTGNGQLLFAYTPFVGDQVTEAALVDFVTADQVTDWSKVRAVVLKSDKLDPSATAMAELGFKITGIKDGSSVVGVTLQDHFTGEHENSTGVSGIYNVAPTYKLEIQRYVDVTTRWIDTDGNELQAPDVQSIMSGATYVTTGITRPHYKFVKVEGQPAGVTAGQDIVVTYIYEADKEIEAQSVKFEQTINYVYAENNQSAAPTVTKTITFTRDKVNNLALNKVTYTPWMVDGKEVVAASFAAVISPEIKGYTADLKEVAAITVTPTDENKAYVTTVKYTKNPTENVTEDKTVTRTINYIYADGTQAVAPNVATKTFTRTGVKDTVTGEITWNAWSQSQEFGAVTSPVLKGYTADKAEVAAQSVTADSANIEVTVMYTKQAATEVSETKEVTRTIKYVYADGTQAAKPVVETKTFTRTGAKDAVTDEITWNEWSQAQEFEAVPSPELKGYTADKTEVAAQSVTADSANTEVTVTYTKQAATEVSETKEVTRTIKYVYADGTQAAKPVVETKTFTRTGAKDAVTDEITWNEWSQAQEFEAVPSPELKGYTADKTEVAAQSVTADSANTEVTVTYTKQAATEVSETKEVTRTINYVYADGLQALAPVVETKTFTRTGTKDAVTDAITWGAWSSAQEFASVMSPQISGYWADRTSVPATTVDHMSPDQVERVIYTANYSLTERFVDNMGNELIPSIVKKNLFVPGMDFDNTADAKVITGYVLQKIENGIGTFGEGDETTTFIYAKVGNIVPVDENGNALVPPVPYENDKDDPFGVTPHQKVPTIPGYKAEVEFVDPTDPTSDTIVKYVAEKTAEVPEVSEKQEPTKTKGVTVPTSQVGPKATTPVTDEAKVAELPQMGDDAKAQVTGVGAMLVALAGILGLGVKNKRKED